MSLTFAAFHTHGSESQLRSLTSTYNELAHAQSNLTASFDAGDSRQGDDERDAVLARITGELTELQAKYGKVRSKLDEERTRRRAAEERVGSASPPPAAAAAAGNDDSVLLDDLSARTAVLADVADKVERLRAHYADSRQIAGSSSPPPASPPSDDDNGDAAALREELAHRTATLAEMERHLNTLRHTYGDLKAQVDESVTLAAPPVSDDGDNGGDNGDDHLRDELAARNATLRELESQLQTLSETYSGLKSQLDASVHVRVALSLCGVMWVAFAVV